MVCVARRMLRAQLLVGERLARGRGEVVRVPAAHAGPSRARGCPRGARRAPPVPPSGRRRRQPAQPAADVQQARRVDGRDDLGPRRQDAAALVLEHRQRDGGVLDGEGAAEPAALGGVRQLQQLEPAHVREQPLGRVADARHAQRVAGGVQRDAPRVRRADVLHAEAADEELGELEEPAAERLRVRRQPLVALLARDAAAAVRAATPRTRTTARPPRPRRRPAPARPPAAAPAAAPRRGTRC